MDPVTSAALISAGGSILGGMFGNNSAKKAANEANAFSERMASTQHQREVIDLKAAGLNPMLSVMGGNGAAAPTGQIADVSKDLLTPALNSANAARTNKTTIDNARLQNYVLSTQANKNVADANLSHSATMRQDAETAMIKAQTPERIVKGKFWDSIDQLLSPAKQLFDGNNSAKELSKNESKITIPVKPSPYRINQDLDHYLLPPPVYK
jgi:hypothetical protein